MFGPIAAALLLTVAAIVLSYLQLRGVRSGPSEAIAPVLVRLKRTPSADRLEVAASATSEGTWERRFADALASAGTEAERADSASELVHELDLGMSSRSKWASAALRIVVLGGVLAACWAMIGGQQLAAAIALGIALFGAAVVASVGRHAKRLEEDQRRQVDTFVDLLLGREAAPAQRARGAAASYKHKRSGR